MQLPGVRSASCVGHVRSIARIGGDRSPTHRVRFRPRTPQDQGGAALRTASRRVDRPALVGRTVELTALSAALGAARAGAATTMVLRGEAGVGKSALLRSFLRSCPPAVDIVLSTAQDDGIPLRPMRALLERLAVRPDAHTSTDLGEVGVHVARALAIRCADRAMVVAVDDAHLADPASCAVLQAIIADLSDRSISAPVRLLVLLAVRDAGEPTARGPSDDGRTAIRPIDRMLHALGTTHEPVVLPLGRLDEAAVAALVFESSGTWPAPQDARRLLAATGGHPLALRLAIDGGSSPTVPIGSLAAGVDQRLARLPAGARDLLEACAVIDEPFDLDLLEHGLGVTDVAARLDDPTLAGIVGRDGPHRRFDHAEFRDRTLATMPSGRAAELHRRAARALLRRGDDDAVLRADHHLDLAGAGSQSEASERRAVAAQAGAIAARRNAWHRSADAYLVALGPGLAHAAELDDHTLFHAGKALIQDSQPRVAEPVFDLAIGRTRDPVRSLEVAIEAIRNQLSMARVLSRRDLVEHLATLADRDDLPPALRSAGWVALADVAYLRGDRVDGLRCCAEAARLAAEAHDRRAQGMAAYAEGLQLLGALRMKDALRAFRDVPRLGGLAEGDVLQSWWKARAGVSALHGGMLAEAVLRLDEAAAHANRFGRIGDWSMVESYRSAHALATGDRGTAAASGWHAVRLFRRSAYPPGQAAYPQLVQLATYAGVPAEAAEVIAAMTTDGLRVPAWVDDLTQHGRFTTSVSAPTATTSGAHRPEQLARLAVAVESASGDSPSLQAATAGLQAAFDAGTVWTTGWVAAVPRLLGRAALHMGNAEDAARWLGLADTATAGAPGERILVDLAWIEVHTALGRATEADLARHRALLAAEAGGWTGLATRAAAVTPPVPLSAPRAAGRRALLFTDMVDSTGLNLRVGDDRFVALLDAHNRVIQEAASGAHGVVFHNTGDGYGVWFVSAADALTCAREIHDRLRSGAAHPPVSVRIGIAAGTAISLGGDLFGVDVVRAARLCGLAPADGTYVDAAVAADGGVAVGDVGPIVLKGFAAPEPVFSLTDTNRPDRRTI